MYASLLPACPQIAHLTHPSLLPCPGREMTCSCSELSNSQRQYFTLIKLCPLQEFPSFSLDFHLPEANQVQDSLQKDIQQLGCNLAFLKTPSPCPEVWTPGLSDIKQKQSHFHRQDALVSTRPSPSRTHSPKPQHSDDPSRDPHRDDPADRQAGLFLILQAAPPVGRLFKQPEPEVSLTAVLLPVWRRR